MYIYKITNTKNFKVYIGQTRRCVKTRMQNGHKDKLNRGSHPNRHLQAAWDKYGCDAFEFEVIQRVELHGEFDIDAAERYWIAYYKSNDPFYGYNKQSGGSVGNLGLPAWNKGLPKIQQPRYGKPLGVEKYMYRMLKSLLNYQVVLDIQPELVDEPIMILTESGWKHSESTKAVMAESARKLPRKNKYGYKGVRYDKRCADAPYLAVYNFDRNTRKILGYFKTPEDAGKAYADFARIITGD